MKTLLALFCIIALASATYTSNWTQCINEEWTPRNVFVTKDAKTENGTLVSACGVVTYAHWYTTFTSLLVNATDGVRAWTSNIPYKYIIPVGSPLCFNYTTDFQNRDVSLRMSGINEYGDVVGCVDIDLKYSDSKFLAFRK